jgi:hypothetical protein
MAEARLGRTRLGSDRWWRLDRFLDAARNARARGLEMAAGLEANAADEMPDTPRDDLLDLIGIESIADQQPATFQLVLEHLARTDGATRDAVRSRLTAEFDSLEPRHRRELLEHDALRGFLEHVGVVSAWNVRMPVTAGPSSEPIDRQSFLESVESELDDTIGDAYHARTEIMADSLPSDDELIEGYRRARAHVEGYWRHWALAPSPQALVAYIAMDPDEFKRYLALAVEVLTPAERARFSNRNELNGWIASGMRPLSVDGQDVPLKDVIDPGYLPTLAF